MKHKTYEVLCVGAVNIDTIALVDRLPAVDERMIADEFVGGHGGPAATAAVALARLGHSVAVCATVGRDAEGDAIIAGLDAEGVDVGHIVRDRDVPTARSIVIVDRATRSRAIVTSAFASRPRDIPSGVSEIVHVDQAGYRPVAEARANGDLAGMRLSIDAGNPIAGLSLQDVWLYAPTVAAVRERFGADLAGSIRAAHAEGAEIVVATDGSRGSFRSDGPDAAVIEAPAFAVDVVSSLGAGDVFHGALLASLLEERDPREGLLRANACAALSCSALDGRSGIPTTAQLDAFLAATSVPAL